MSAEVPLVGRGGSNRSGAVTAWRLHLLADGLHDVPRIVLFLPAADVGDGAVALDARGFERGTNDGGISRRRKHQEDQALAAPGVVAGEILKIRTRLGDEEVEPATP